jgi:GNAT superfamily N-acetyltransferase
LPSRGTRDYELNELQWWEKWVDETTWVSKNCYAFFSEKFKDEWFFNRGGFLEVERVPDKVVQAMEKEFSKRGRRMPCILVEEGRPWDKLLTSLSRNGYVGSDKMLVMESRQKARGSKSHDSKVEISVIGPRPKARELQDWTRTYLDAFYGDQKLNKAVGKIMSGVVKDTKASVILARVGKEAAGCAAMFRTAGGITGAYCIGTAPRFRRRGVAAAMVAFMLKVAQSEGRRLVLQTMASDSLEGFYKKQGLALAYTKKLLERRPKALEEGLPCGETFGIAIDRKVAAGTTKPFVEVFSGFEAIQAVKALFGSDTKKVISQLKISLDSPRGYLRVDGETGNIIINPEYLKTGHERHLYLDVIHELAHVKQFLEGKELYDRRYAYFERPTEIEAYQVAVEEARRIGMGSDEIVDYLRVEWVTEDEFQKFVSMMRIEG